MAAANLLALLDDIATLMDDIATMSKVAAQKTAGAVSYTHLTLPTNREV